MGYPAAAQGENDEGGDDKGGDEHGDDDDEDDADEGCGESDRQRHDDVAFFAIVLLSQLAHTQSGLSVMVCV
jgi:hypothetical protein